jgi:hypothetical protein
MPYMIRKTALDDHRLLKYRSPLRYASTGDGHHEKLFALSLSLERSVFSQLAPPTHLRQNACILNMSPNAFNHAIVLSY